MASGTNKISQSQVSSTSGRSKRGLPNQQAMQLFLQEAGWKKAEKATDQAQALIYDAWEATTKRERTKLAKQALTISPLCADAFVLLAELEANSLEKALDYYQRGVEAGELALGKHAKEYHGHYWGFLETRPYMRAREGLAGTRWELGKHTEAIGHYQAMLELNPNDNQGVRYSLASHLLTMENFAALKKLLQEYERDHSTAMVYSKVLLAFRENDPQAVDMAKEAFASNKYVPEGLAGVRAGVTRNDGYMTVGGEDEATYYVEDNLAVWKATPGAIEWLLQVAAELNQ